MKTVEQRSLTKEQKDAVGLLSIGTFLEYFDLMLYVHMAVLLNELFFPKTDPFTTSLIAAFTFCSTFIFRPIGALIFGYMGDTIGRKSTVILTTFIMAFCSFIMAILPTYTEIGLTASCIMILCRVMQGMAAMGESIGAEIYLTETIKPPLQYPMVGLLVVFSVVGGTVALGVASFTTSFGINWRYAFWIGAVIALIGTIARTTLREAPDFADAKRSLQALIKQSNKDPKVLENSIIGQEKVSKTTTFFFLIIQCIYPLAFYFVYIHCSDILKNSFGFTSEQVIHHNFMIALSELGVMLFFTYLSYKVYPLKILKVNLVIITILFLICPYLLNNITSSVQLLFIQILLVVFASGEFPASPIFYKHFPIFKRFTYSCMIYALGRAIMFIITSFGLVYLIEYFNNWGILLISIPTLLTYKFALSHFENLEGKRADYLQKRTYSE
ncbi:MAG: MFS transporter [Rickettsiales bacterium]|nr:MFS transporter [Rickettsiales bacterium]